MNRRRFIIRSTSLAAGTLLPVHAVMGRTSSLPVHLPHGPLVVSTWDFGLAANEKAWEILSMKGTSLDAVEAGIRQVEADPGNHSVGIGGFPDRDGMVTLDACIMDETGRAGSVTFLRNIMHPISVARKVMEKTPHVILSGEGALQFALSEGFSAENLLTDEMKLAWENWKKDSSYNPVINFENHDTIGMLSIDHFGNIAGGCSTSGLAFKMHGRVGDSPVIGAGLFVDNEVGAAVATGLGEMMLKTLSSFLAVEMMRAGNSPQKACELAIRRIAEKVPEHKEHQAAILAISRNGSIGAFAIHKGFSFAMTTASTHEILSADTLY